MFFLILFFILSFILNLKILFLMMGEESLIGLGVVTLDFFFLLNLFLNRENLYFFFEANFGLRLFIIFWDFLVGLGFVLFLMRFQDFGALMYLNPPNALPPINNQGPRNNPPFWLSMIIIIVLEICGHLIEPLTHVHVEEICGHLIEPPTHVHVDKYLLKDSMFDVSLSHPMDETLDPNVIECSSWEAIWEYYEDCTLVEVIPRGWSVTWKPQWEYYEDCTVVEVIPQRTYSEYYYTDGRVVRTLKTYPTTISG